MQRSTDNQGRPPGRRQKPVQPRAGAVGDVTAKAGASSSRDGNAAEVGADNRGYEPSQGSDVSIRSAPKPGRRSKWRAKRRGFDSLAQGNLSERHQSLVQAEIGQLEAVVRSLRFLSIPAPVRSGTVLSILTDLSSDSSLAGALLLARSTYLTTRFPAIVLCVLRAPAQGVPNVCTMYCGTPNTSGCQDQIWIANADDLSSPVDERHVACPAAQAALERGYLGVAAVMRAYRMPISRIADVCPCRWLVQLPPWSTARSGEIGAHSRLLSKQDLMAVAEIRFAQKACRPYHLRQCQCARRTRCIPCPPREISPDEDSHLSGNGSIHWSDRESDLEPVGTD